MKKILFIYFFILSISAVGQTYQPNPKAGLDSLWNVWRDTELPDTARLNALNRIGEYYWFPQPDTAIYFSKLQHDYAKSKGLKKYMAQALRNKGGAFWIKGDNASAINLYIQSLKLFEEIGDKTGIAFASTDIGGIYWEQGNYQSAIAYFTRSLEIKEEIGESMNIVGSLNNIGSIFKEQGDAARESGNSKLAKEFYANAINYYTRSLKIRAAEENNQGIAGSLNHIGAIYKAQSDFVKALDYYKRSLTIYESIKSKKGIANLLYNIGIIYENQRNNVLAIDHFSRSLIIWEELNDEMGMSKCLNRLGLISFEKREYAKAIEQCTRIINFNSNTALLREENKKAAFTLYKSYKAIGGNKLALAMH